MARRVTPAFRARATRLSPAAMRCARSRWEKLARRRLVRQGKHSVGGPAWANRGRGSAARQPGQATVSRGRRRRCRGRLSSSWCTACRVQCISRPISASVKPRVRNSAACRRRPRFGFPPLAIALPPVTSPAMRGGGEEAGRRLAGVQGLIPREFYASGAWPVSPRLWAHRGAGFPANDLVVWDDLPGTSRPKSLGKGGRPGSLPEAPYNRHPHSPLVNGEDGQKLQNNRGAPA
jgi:hypothetical protein